MKDTKNWSRDWAGFDWTQVVEKLEKMKGKERDDKAGYDVGISREEFLEYLEWLNRNDKEGYYRAVLSIQLSEIGLDDGQIETLVAHPDELIRILKFMIKE